MNKVFNKCVDWSSLPGRTDRFFFQENEEESAYPEILGFSVRHIGFSTGQRLASEILLLFQMLQKTLRRRELSACAV